MLIVRVPGQKFSAFFSYSFNTFVNGDRGTAAEPPDFCIAQIIQGIEKESMALNFGAAFQCCPDLLHGFLMA